MRWLLLNTTTMVPGEDGGNDGGNKQQHLAYSKEANIDTNMVIILVALLCALICAVGINSIVRWALRCSRRLGYESSDVAMTGVKKKTLKQIPVAVYVGRLEIPASECPICLGEFIDGEKVRVLPQCNHGFHVRCVDVWLGSHSTCPTCRRSVVVAAGRSWDGGDRGGDARVITQEVG